MTKTALLSLAVAVAAGCGGGASYVEKNERLLETLPELPGAVRKEVRSTAYNEYEGPKIIGYTTNVVYVVPPETTAWEVIDFYVQNLKEEWQYRFEEVPVTEGLTAERIGTVLLAQFAKGTATVSVNTDGIFPDGPQTIEVAVDHDHKIPGAGCWWPNC